ncbi:MAG: N-acetylglucosamine-6-phosphate deacetylase [Kiritimatiellia bacterium]
MHNEGTVLAQDYATGQGVRLAWKSGLIVSAEPSAAPTERWIAPALTDLQVNGYGAVDFSSPALTADGMRKAVRELHRDGCAQFFPTFITDAWPAMIARLQNVREWRRVCPELRGAIAGWHFEGPFMSPVPGYCGAHPKERMISPTPAHIRQLREAAGDDPLLLTMAPEQAGVLEIIPLAVSLGIRVSLGHTNASAEQIASAIRAGAISFTHLGNGSPQSLDRHDNILWRVIEARALHVGLIPDGIHVSPALFRILHRALDPARFWYTTDAVHPAGAPPGRYMLGETEVEVGPDQVVRKPGASNFAGSALRPLEGVLRAAEMLGCSWRDVWNRYALQPRSMMGLDTDLLAPGKPANFCVLDFTGGDRPSVATYIGGEQRSALPAQGWMRGAGIT